MKSKLYKTHRNPSYYRLRRLGYFSLSLMVATLLVVVPLTFASAASSSIQESSPTTNPSSSSSMTITSEDGSTNETEADQQPQEVNAEKGVTYGYHFITKHQNA